MKIDSMVVGRKPTPKIHQSTIDSLKIDKMRMVALGHNSKDKVIALEFEMYATYPSTEQTFCCYFEIHLQEKCYTVDPKRHTILFESRPEIFLQTAYSLKECSEGYMKKEDTKNEVMLNIIKELFLSHITTTPVYINVHLNPRDLDILNFVFDTYLTAQFVEDFEP